MDPLASAFMVPLIERDLRLALRRNAAWSRLGTAGLGVLLALALIALGSHGAPGAQGQNLFRWLFFIAASKAVFETFRFSIDLISSERRNQTLGLLILTGLGSSEIFLGKLGAALIVQLFGSLALLPCFAVSFVLGGVPPVAFLAVALFLPVITILALTVSLAASSMAWDEDGSTVIAALIGMIVVFTGPALHYGLHWLSPIASTDAWLLLSPLYGLLAIWDLFPTAQTIPFMMNCGVATLYSLACGSIACTFLRRDWRDSHFQPELEGVGAGPRTLRRRTKLKAWLDRSPLAWLILRDARSQKLAWAVVLVTAGIWFAGVALAPSRWGNLLSGLVCALVQWTFVGVLAMFHVAKRIGEDRRSGALELLLTTPLSVSEIIAAQCAGLWAAYRRLMQFLIVLDLLLALAIVAERTWTTLEFWIMLQCWGIVGCVTLMAMRSQTVSQVIWVALNTGRPLLALVKVVCPPSVFASLGFFFYTLLQIGWPARFPQESLPSLCLTGGMLFGTAVLAWLSGMWDPSGERLSRNFRWVVQQPLPDSSDTRWRRWDITKPYPQRATPPIFSKI